LRATDARPSARGGLHNASAAALTADHLGVTGLEILLALGVFALALVIVPALLLFGGAMLATVLTDDRPETYLSDPAARRGLLRG
jgi:hypothetical protein